MGTTSSTKHDAQQLTELSHFLSSRSPILLLLNEKNTRKFPVIQERVNNGSFDFKSIHITGHESIKPKQILNQICGQQHKAIPEKSLRFEDQLKHALNELKKEEQQYLLFIDYAHRLPLSTLAALSHLALLQEKTSAHLQIILSGKQELTERISSLVTRPIPHIHINTKNLTGIRHYIKSQHSIKNSVLDKLDPYGFRATLSHQLNYLWRQHHVKAISLLSLGAISSALLYIPTPSSPTKTLTTLAKADAKRRSTPPQYEIMLADSTQQQPLTRLIKTIHLKQKTTILRDHFTHHYHVHVGRFSTYKAAQTFLIHMPHNVKKYHPHIHQLIS